MAGKFHLDTVDRATSAPGMSQRDTIIMGKFEGAVRAAEARAPIAPTLASTETVSRGVDSSANRRMRRVWLETVLKPVIADANEDLKARKLAFSINAKEDDYSIFVEVLFFGYAASPINLTVTIGNDGRVKIYVLSGQGIEIGTIENPDRALLEDQIVRFIERQTSEYLQNSRRFPTSTAE